MEQFTIGLDFGTESARALLVDADSGTITATAVSPYPDGVIDEVLPGTTIKLPPNYALQNPQDWLTALQKAVAGVLEESGVHSEQVVGLGIDFTSCTILPTLEDGTPLCKIEELKNKRHAWAKLWKHHGAQPQADRINKLASERGESWLPRYGGKISSEWLLPKALEILEESPETYKRMAVLIEGADWVAWQLTGILARNTCCSGYKATWHKQEGYPGKQYLTALHPDLTTVFSEKARGNILAPGQKVGALSAEWANRLGLKPGTPVSAPIIDAHAAAIGGGLSEPGTMFLIMGTSTCHMIMSGSEVLVEGISGVVEDGIIPGWFGYEAGQVSVGDIFGWFVEQGVPQRYEQEAKTRSVSLHELVSEKALKLRAGESGLLALDWWNGCRTPLVDADLSGLVMGYRLQTTPEELYRALVEATAFGTRLIIELFQEGNIPVHRLLASGGLTQNELVLQVYADVMGMPLEITSSPQASALGAAILGAVAGGIYPDITAAVKNMVGRPSRVIEPDASDHAVYNEIYKEYKKLVDLLGRIPNSPMKRILDIRRQALEK